MRPTWWTSTDSTGSHHGDSSSPPGRTGADSILSVCGDSAGGDGGAEGTCLRVAEMAGELDQWLWGDSVMVTPVVHKGMRARDVQVWRLLHHYMRVSAG